MKDKNFLSLIILTVSFSAASFALLHFGLVNYGYTLFLLTPVVIGFFLGQRPSFKLTSLYAVIIGLVAFLYLLVTTQLEGFFCVITLCPLLLPLVFAGAFVGWHVRNQLNKRADRKDTVRVTIYPLIILLFAGLVEHYFISSHDQNKVISTSFYPYDKGRVFDYIKSVDTVDAEKPTLMSLGLPIPERCVLEKEAPGANRTCYFQEGEIDEEITEIRRGEVLSMKVTRYGLPGRHWLKFNDAIYYFKEEGNGTKVTRVTSYQTELKPRFYWQFWEEAAISAEHEYVFADLKRRLNRDAVRQGD